MEKQQNKKTGLRFIEEELLSANQNALEEEQTNVQRHYDYFEDKLDYLVSHYPYPDVKEDDMAWDYDSMYELNLKKQRNRENLELQQKYRPYCTTGKLCCGHVKRGNSDFFITQTKGLHSINLTDDRRNMMLIHTDDKMYQEILKQWRHPSDDEDVGYSRMIRMQDKQVQNVEVLLDRTTETTLDVTDSFLKQALIKNKNNSGITSIIETIQQKQDDIRLMPTDASFVVQGCAGSGKTMILLHRLRYLLFNEEFKNSDYVLLVPSTQFKTFIHDIAEEFDIYHRNIMPYTEYYQFALGEKAEYEEKNELLLSEEMLTEVYSKEFVRKCFQAAVNEVRKQNQDLLDYLESCLNDILVEYTADLENEITYTNNTAVKSIQELIEPFEEYLECDDYSSLENTAALRREISQLVKKQEKLDEQRKSISVTPVTENDERVIRDSRILSLQADLTREEEAYARSTIFSRGAHKRKIEQLNIQLASMKKQLIQKLQDMDYQKAFDGLEENPVFTVISLQDLTDVYVKIGEIYSASTQKIRKNREKLKNVEEDHIPQFLIKASNGFTSLYDRLTMFDSVKDLYTEEVEPVSTYLPEYIHLCRTDIEKINELFSEESILKNEKEKAPVFFLSSEQSIQNQFCRILMNEAERIVNEKYQKTMNASYKHYWYLRLYFTFLSKEVNGKLPHYIFIDEAQDLSVSEIELMKRIHTGKETNGDVLAPVMNLFGDVNQTIMDHGIRNWNQVDFIHSVFRLDENFRNTNQIVDYCNKVLSMNMTKVGVDMKNVGEYKDFADYMNHNNRKDTVYIVKNEEIRSTFQAILTSVYHITDADIYTVKEVKGLEFKAVTVLMEKMTRNERYISYTRALTDLSVVKEC
ncbi:MAG: hypothetical protein ACI32N_05635 [Bulleidia sp.]